MQKLHVLAAACIALGFAACIIGPKQDDPLTDKGPTTDDAGFSSDTNPAEYADTGAGDPSTTGPDAGGGGGDTAPIDASGDANDGEVGDAACADGGFVITAIGPWNDKKGCWETTTHAFECADGADGGAAFTCFVKLSTSELFLAPTTQIPTGSDYRACTDAERMAAPETSRCK